MNAVTRTVRFGPASISLQSDAAAEPVVAALARWLPCERETQDADVALTVHSTRLESESGDAASAQWWDGKAWEASLRRETRGISWTVTPRENSVVAATRFVPDAAIRVAHVHRFGRVEMRASALLYGHILPGAELALLQRGATLVHASSLTGPLGGGVLVLGWGGAGKTSASTSLYLRQPGRWRAMSDDLAIVSRDGLLHRSPVPINVFPYNTELFPELAAYVTKGAGFADRQQWQWRARLLGGSGVARRFAPFAEFVGPPSAPLKAVVELRREDVSTPIVEAADAKQIAAEARRVLAHELARGFRPMNRLYEEGRQGLPFPSPDAQLDAAEAILLAATAHCRVVRITLPRRTPPTQVGALVEQVVQGVA